MKLSQKISIYLAVVLVIASVILTTYEINRVKGIINKNYDELNGNDISVKSLYINTYIETKLNNIKKIANKFEKAKNLSPEFIKEIIEDDNKILDFQGLFIGLTNGDVYKAEPDLSFRLIPNFDGRTRAWFKEANEIRKASLSSIYKDVSSGKQATTIFAPVFINNEIAAVVGGNILVDDFSDEITRTNSLKNSSTIILDKNDEIISSSNKDDLGNPEWKKEFVTKLHDFYKSNKSGNFVFSKNNEDFLAYCVVDNLTGYDICAVMPKANIDETIHKSVLNSIFEFSLFILVVIGVLYFLIKSSLKPIEIIQKSLIEVFAFI
ncbi:cache domain-containing protein, partial [Campylobacter sp. Cr9]|uniref:PDC sensor domain-containing protein n=1 Tax=Campylobacter sp. Cr9 TaxID=2735728 RepID=UPI003015511C|nr:cache domain-containing protein [Campylobacter sp. Cr9]